ncbi:calcium-binding protein [Streptomyces sp. 6N223]|uniref:calcium-binding protein n=1 Tax=Streptomyces sp. 6N223 TaxID=3457412 RepID=UPI003FCF656B
MRAHARGNLWGTTRGITRTITGHRPAVFAGLGVIALAGTALAASPAAAADERSSGTAYTNDAAHAVYYTADGTSSDVRITQGEAGATEFVIDDIVPVAVGDGCVHPDASDATYVVCTLTDFGDFYSSVGVSLGGGNDSLWLRAGAEATVHGGSGHDDLNVNGGTVVYGDTGDDWLQGGWLKYGGEGHDGMSGFRDWYEAYGEDGDDYIMGGTGNEYLFGGRGHDFIEAGAGADYVSGNAGDDVVFAGKGNDDVYGGDGGDVLFGNSGNDYLRGGAGDDSVSGGPGTDDVQD